MTDAERRAAAIRAAVLKAQRAVVQLDRENLDAVERLYREALADVQARISGWAGSDGVLTLRELQSASQQIENILQRLARERQSLLDGAIRDASRLGVAPFEPAGAGGMVVSQAGMRVAEGTVRWVTAYIAADGLQLSDRIWRLTSGERRAIVGALERAIIQGSSAEQAMRDYLLRGQEPPAGLAEKARSGSADAVRHAVIQPFSEAANNARRVMRTEINRAHGEAFMGRARENPDVIGFRFMLSPRHPETDVCDLLAQQNLHGLGPGVYPKAPREACPWPAHPNTLSFLEVVFADEVTTADRAGQESQDAALKRLPAEVRDAAIRTGKRHGLVG